MTKEQALKNLKYEERNYSDNAIDVLEQTIELMYQNEILDIDFNTIYFEDVQEIIEQVINDYFIYYSDAFNYLMDNDHVDFKDAFNNNCYDICQIATFFLLEECLKLIDPVFFIDVIFDNEVNK